jgi:hypothetical protein
MGRSKNANAIFSTYQKNCVHSQNKDELVFELLEDEMPEWRGGLLG